MPPGMGESIDQRGGKDVVLMAKHRMPSMTRRRDRAIGDGCIGHPAIKRHTPETTDGTKPGSAARLAGPRAMADIYRPRMFRCGLSADPLGNEKEPSMGVASPGVPSSHVAAADRFAIVLEWLLDAYIRPLVRGCRRARPWPGGSESVQPTPSTAP